MTEFFEVINSSAMHIYNSVLTLTPKSSIVRKLYNRYVRPSPRVVVGLPASWDPCIASTVLSTQHPDVTWSPCGRFVAVSTGAGVEIRDSTTLEKLSALESPASLLSSGVAIAYSPNGRLLACACTRPFSFEMAIAIWDIQTGGMVKAIYGGEPGYPSSMLYSSDGKMLSVACGKSPYKWTVCTFDTLSGERGCSVELESEFNPVFWTEKGSIRFATSSLDHDGLCIDTWEIISTLNGRPTKIDSFHVHHEFDNNHQISFSPANLRVAVVSVNSTTIKDARDSKPLLEAPASRTLGSYAGHFSPDGSLFACTEQQDIHIWKATSEGYVCWGRFPLRFSAAAGGAFAFSPDSGSVIGWGLGIMEAWKVDHHIDPPSSEQSPDFWNSHLVAFSANRTHVAIGQVSSSTVMVVDLDCGASKLIIDTEMGVVDIKIVDDSVFVLGEMTVISWGMAFGSYEGDDTRYVGPDESLKIVEMEGDYCDFHQDPRLLDDQCQMVVLTSADSMFLLDANTGAHLTTYDSPLRFQDFRFSPDGQQLWVSYVYVDGGGDSESDIGDGSEDEDGVGCGSEVGEEGVDCDSEVDEEGVDCESELDEEGSVLGPMGEESEEGLEIVEDEETGEITLVPLPSDVQPPSYPWESSKGYQLMGQWVLDGNGRRLLWLPPHWRVTNKKMWRWNEDFFVVQKSTLPEPVIIQLSLT